MPSFGTTAIKRLSDSLLVRVLQHRQDALVQPSILIRSQGAQRKTIRIRKQIRYLQESVIHSDPCGRFLHHGRIAIVYGPVLKPDRRWRKVLRGKSAERWKDYRPTEMCGGQECAGSGSFWKSDVFKTRRTHGRAREVESAGNCFPNVISVHQCRWKPYSLAGVANLNDILQAHAGCLSKRQSLPPLTDRRESIQQPIAEVVLSAEGSSVHRGSDRKNSRIARSRMVTMPHLVARWRTETHSS